jgi:hypothetical protein
MYNHCNMCNIPIYFFNIRMRHLQHISEIFETLKTYVYNMCFSPFFHMTQCRAGDGRFRLASSREWWCGLAAGSCACAWPGPSQRHLPLLAAWPGRGEGRSTAGDGGVAALAEHAYEARRRRTRRRRPGLPAVAIGGAAGSIAHAEDSSSLQETEVPRGWGCRRGWRRRGADWDGRTAARHRDATTHKCGVGETSFHGDLIF